MLRCSKRGQIVNEQIIQARVTLARAIYSTAEILLLDDILAALDVHTSKWIVDKCLKGDLVQGRTVILVVSKDNFRYSDF